MKQASAESGGASGLPLNHYDALPAVAVVGDDHGQAGRPYKEEAKLSHGLYVQRNVVFNSTCILSLQPSRHFCRSLMVVGSYRVCIRWGVFLQTGPVAGRHLCRMLRAAQWRPDPYLGVEPGDTYRGLSGNRPLPAWHREDAGRVDGETASTRGLGARVLCTAPRRGFPIVLFALSGPELAPFRTFLTRAREKRPLRFPGT